LPFVILDTINVNPTEAFQASLKEWKKQSQYHGRSLVENAFFRLKTIFTEKLRARTEDRRRTEALIRCAVMNRLTGLGKPDSQVVA
jgi:hypothetical protein